MQIDSKLSSKIETLKVGSGVIKWAIGLVVARCILLILVQGIIAFYYHTSGHSTPWASAAKWWTVYGSAVDLSCLLLLFFALKQEGKSLSSLIDFDKKRIFKDLKTGVLIYILIFPLVGLAYSLGLGYLIFNESTLDSIVGQLAERTLPTWAYFYSIFIWWIIWSTTEELTYQAYSLPRLLSKYSQVKVFLLIGFFWALQHSFLPLIFDWRFILWRLLAFFPLVICLMIAYMKTGRITPVIFAHAMMDFSAAYFTFKH